MHLQGFNVKMHFSFSIFHFCKQNKFLRKKLVSYFFRNAHCLAAYWILKLFSRNYYLNIQWNYFFEIQLDFGWRLLNQNTTYANCLVINELYNLTFDDMHFEAILSNVSWCQKYVKVYRVKFELNHFKMTSPFSTFLDIFCLK